MVLKTSTDREIDAAFDTFVRERPDALFVDPDPLFRKPACPIGPLGIPPRGPRDIRVS
jgi:hypothetical protein